MPSVRPGPTYRRCAMTTGSLRLAPAGVPGARGARWCGRRVRNPVADGMRVDTTPGDHGPARQVVELMVDGSRVRAGHADGIARGLPSTGRYGSRETVDAAGRDHRILTFSSTRISASHVDGACGCATRCRARSHSPCRDGAPIRRGARSWHVGRVGLRCMRWLRGQLPKRRHRRARTIAGAVRPCTDDVWLLRRRLQPRRSYRARAHRSMTPDLSGPVNRGHACVKGRFAFGFATSADRLTTPLVRRDGSAATGVVG